jgi:hypothetical protein
MDELTLFHELTLFRDFRSDTPGPSAAETEAARARLLEAIADQTHTAPRTAPRQRRWAWPARFGRRRFWAPVAAAVAVMAVAITMVLLAVPGHTAAPKPKPAVHQRHHVVHRAHGVSKQADHGTAAGGAGGKRAGTGAAGAASPGSRSATPGAGSSPGSGGSGSATATRTALTASAGQLSPGQTVTLTATVTSQANDLSGGTVSFYVDAGQNDVYPATSESVCSDVQVSDGVATCAYTPQSAQTDILFAEFSGYQQYQASDSGSDDVTVTAATTTTLKISSTQVSPGQTVTLTATVTDQAGDGLSGTVSFYVDVGQNGVYSGGMESVCSDVQLSDGVATCTYTPESAQTDQLSAEYSGYGEYAESSAGVDLTVT